MQHLATSLSHEARLPVTAAPGCGHTAASPVRVQPLDPLRFPAASWVGTSPLRHRGTSQAPRNHVLPQTVVPGGPAQAAQAARHGAAAPSLTPCCKLVSSGQLIYYLETHFPLAAESLTSKQLAKVMNFSAVAVLKGDVNPFSSGQGDWRWWPMNTSGPGVPTPPAAPCGLLTPV